MKKNKDEVIVIRMSNDFKQALNKISNVIYASSYKSKNKVLQSIGRSLRTDPDKEYATLYDIVDNLSKLHKIELVKSPINVSKDIEDIKHAENTAFNSAFFLTIDLVVKSLINFHHWLLPSAFDIVTSTGKAF